MPETEGDLNQTLDQAVHVLVRRRWWIIVPTAVAALATVGFSITLPNRYSSEATLVAVQQQISQTFVAPIVTTTVADVVNAMTREILSRNRLLAVIDEFGLYAKERLREAPEQLAERMRKDVEIEPLDLTPAGSLTAFKISFSAGNAQLAQQVTSRLTSLFIEENLRTRESQAAKTTDFLNEQLAAAKQRVTQQERRLEDFKRNNLGELPEQQASNVGALAELRMQLSTARTNARRAEQQRMSLQASLESLIAGNVVRLESEKTALLSRLTPKHPDVLKKDQDLARMKTLLERVKRGSGIDNIQGLSVADELSVSQLKTQMEANAAELETLSAEAQRLQTEISSYQQRVNLTPLREQQLAALLRDYDLYNKDYSDLLNKQLRSQQAASLEERQEGQHFRLVDPPTLPVLPSSPKRARICLAGAAAGVLLGLVLAFLANMRDRSFYSDKELKQHFPIPLVLAVPTLLTPAEQRRRNWARAVEWLAGAAIALVVCAAEFYVYRRG